jgi:hypothetical protein
MLHVKLRDPQPPPADDPMDRSWIGYDPTVPSEELWRINCGRWKLGPRAAREGYVVFSYEGEVKFVAEIHGLEPSTDKRQIIRGRLLGPDEPLAQRWVGREAPDHNRNPVSYFQDPDAGPSTCACGCGGAVSAHRAFLPGHDQKAIHSRIVERWGDTLGFIVWYDAHRDEIDRDDG